MGKDRPSRWILLSCVAWIIKECPPPMERNLHGERAFCVFVRFRWIYSACGFRLTHGLAPQQADTEPVHCFIATDSWSTPLSSIISIAQKYISASGQASKEMKFSLRSIICTLYRNVSCKQHFSIWPLLSILVYYSPHFSIYNLNFPLH